MKIRAPPHLNVRRELAGAGVSGAGAEARADGDACLGKVNVGPLEHTDFGGTEAVAVSHGKDGAVALVFDGGEELAHLVLGEESNDSVLASLD